jgi:hypothetical protein
LAIRIGNEGLQSWLPIRDATIPAIVREENGHEAAASFHYSSRHRACHDPEIWRERRAYFALLAARRRRLPPSLNNGAG